MEVRTGRAGHAPPALYYFYHASKRVTASWAVSATLSHDRAGRRRTEEPLDGSLRDVRVGDGLASNAQSCVVSMRPGREYSVADPAVVLLPPFGGSPAVYGDLLRHIGTAYPVLGLQSYGLLDPKQADPTVPAMARRFTADLLATGAIQRCLVLGYSMGGTVAVETARLLSIHGVRRVAVLLVESLPTHGDLEVSAPFYTLLRDVLRIEVDVAGLAAIDAETRLQRIRDAAAEQGKLGRRFPVARLRTMARVCAVNQAAAASFVPEFYPGAVHSMRAVGNNVDTSGWIDPWHPYAARVTTEYFVGSHFDALSEPAVSIVAAAVQWRLTTLESG